MSLPPAHPILQARDALANSAPYLHRGWSHQAALAALDAFIEQMATDDHWRCPECGTWDGPITEGYCDYCSSGFDYYHYKVKVDPVVVLPLPSEATS